MFLRRSIKERLNQEMKFSQQFRHHTSSKVSGGSDASDKAPVVQDNRPQSIIQRQMHQIVNESPRIVTQRKAFTEAHGVGNQHNTKGIPGKLRHGLEGLSGMDLSDVKVHYGSVKPASVDALAYAQGNDIYLGPGQEKHLPHEAWHVVQQRQGRVQPTMQMKGGICVNDNDALEKEADIIGARALMNASDHSENILHHEPPAATFSPVIQCKRRIGKFGLEAEVIGERFEISAFSDDPEAALLRDSNVSFEEYKLGSIWDHIDVTLDNEVCSEKSGFVERNYTVEFIQKPIDIIEGKPEDITFMAGAWESVQDYWKARLGDPFSSGILEIFFTEETHWKGGQFSPYKDILPGVVAEEDDDEYKLDWNKIGFGLVNAKTPDPRLSIQLTVGSQLEALQEAFKATSQILKTGNAPSEEDIRKIKNRPPGDEGKKAKQEVISLIHLLRSYIYATRELPDNARTKRYAKEYMPLMVRNSLNSVFEGMSPRGRNLFIKATLTYLNGVQDALLRKGLGISPEDRVFVKAALKEGVATAITMEDLLLSIINYTRTNEGIEPNNAPSMGDIFSQTGLAGISEITGSDPEILEKYGINAPTEMMRDQTGLIFENRAAKVFRLSEMPDIFNKVVAVLELVNMEVLQEKEKTV